MKTAYLHIGLEKTGTTSLQIFMQENPDALNNNNIVYLGDSSKAYMHGIGHFPIVASFYEKCPNIVPPHKHKPTSEVLNALSKDVENTEQDIVLSCEHFSSRLSGSENLRALRDALSGCLVKIICYLRPQDDQAVSLYSTLVKGGRTAPFTIEDVTPENRYFNYKVILDTWAEVFGVKNIILREYARDSLIGKDICTDFLSILSVDPEGFIFIEDQNISLDSRQAEILRRVNRHLTSFPWGTWDVDLQKFEQSQNIRTALTPLLPKGAHISSLMSNEERQEVLHRFKKSNLKIAEDFKDAAFIRNWYDRGFSYRLQSTPSNVTATHFEKALIACGSELNKKTSQMSEMSMQHNMLLEERDNLIIERDTAIQALNNLHSEIEASKSKVKKALKKLSRRAKKFLFSS